MPLHFKCWGLDEDQTILRVSPRTLDRAFAATDPELHASVHEGKVETMMEAENLCLRAPIVGAYDGRICFENGRHRARAAMRMGQHKSIPVIVDKDNVAKVRDLLAKFSK